MLFYESSCRGVALCNMTMETRWIPPAPTHEVIDATTSAIGASVVDLHSEIVVSDPLEQYNATPFTPRTYAPSKDVVKLHGFTRFGHTNNVETLITGLSDNESELTTTYILGVTSGPPPPARRS